LLTTLIKIFVPLIAILLTQSIHSQVLLKNISYPPGQKVLVGIESGQIENGIKVLLTKDGKPFPNQKVSFRILHSPSMNDSSAHFLIESVLTDDKGEANTSFKIGDKHGSYILGAFYNDSIDVSPAKIEVSAYKSSWIFLLILGMLGGLAIFLFGMDMSADGLQKVAGDKMRTILGKLTNNPFMGVVVGTLTTAAIQSSSATTVMVVGFVTATLMTLTQAIGVIYGANIGTTLTVQLIAFNISEYSPLMIAVGFGLSLTGGKYQYLKFIGMIVMGFGFIFFGMGMMSEAMNPLRSVSAFTELLASFATNPILGVLFATIFTGIIQSSGAVIGISIALASQGILTLPAAIVISFGSNIGTCATALLSSVNASRAGKRVALVHLLFNTLGVIIFMPFIGQFTTFVQYVTKLMGTTSISREIANAHMFFNVINTLIFIFFTKQMANFVEYLVPIKIEEKKLEFAPLYLNDEIKSSSIALEQSFRELVRLDDIVKGLIEKIPQLWKKENNLTNDFFNVESKKVDILTRAIHDYVSKLAKLTLSDKESKEAAFYLHAVDDMKHISYAVVKDLVGLIERYPNIANELNEVQKSELEIFHSHSLELMEKNDLSFRNRKIEHAEESALLYIKLKNLARKVVSREISFVLKDGESEQKRFTVFVDIYDSLRALCSHINLFSQTILEKMES
jgi:phosphate:Na+ symporter